MSKRLVLVATGAVVITAAWMVSRGVTGRGFGFGDDDCQLSASRGADGVLEAEARCTWPIPAERVDALLAAWGRQAQYFSNLAESTVLENHGERLLVRQIQRASGMSDREVIIECVTEPIPGGVRFRWRKAADQSRSSGRNVEVPVHEGFWTVTSAGDRRSVVEYHMRYLPGGNIPSFVVSMFLSSGTKGVLADLRRAAEAERSAGA